MQCTGHRFAFCAITLPYKDLISTIVSKQFSTKSTLKRDFLGPTGRTAYKLSINSHSTTVHQDDLFQFVQVLPISHPKYSTCN